MRSVIAIAVGFGLTILSCISSSGCSRVNYAILGFLVGEAIYDDPAPEDVKPEAEADPVGPAIVDVHISVDVSNDGVAVAAEQGGPDGDGALPVTINVTVSEEHDDGMDRQGNRPPNNRPPGRNENDGDAPGRGHRQDNQGHDHEAHDDHRHNAGGTSG